MRKANGSPYNELRPFVPTSFGNNTDANPVTVWIRYPTERQRREVSALGDPVRFPVGVDGKPLNDDDGNPIVEMDMMAENKRQHFAVSRYVEKVANYTDSKGNAIDDGNALAEHGETQIVLEVYNEIMLGLSPEVDSAKKSDRQPTSSSAETIASSGIAPNAESSILTRQGTATGTATHGSSMSYSQVE